MLYEDGKIHSIIGLDEPERHGFWTRFIQSSGNPPEYKTKSNIARWFGSNAASWQKQQEIGNGQLIRVSYYKGWHKERHE